MFFSNSGTEHRGRHEVVRWNTGQERFIAFLGAFHGRTLGSLSLTASRPVQQERFFPTVPGAVHVPYAYCYRCAYGMEPSSCGAHCARVIEEVYFSTTFRQRRWRPYSWSPFRGRWIHIPPKQFIKDMAAICRRHGILLVDDEVPAGMGRTGRMWAIEHFDVAPDILCTAKALGSGLPIAHHIPGPPGHGARHSTPLAETCWPAHRRQPPRRH